MQNYIWIVLIIFVAAIAAYMKRTKGSDESENEGDARYLIGMGGTYRGQKFPIGKEIIIGRDAEQCGIVYPNSAKGISAVHCKVTIEGDRIAVIDLASTYGTFRNTGEKLAAKTAYYLAPGDGFYVGNAENTFLIK